MRTTRCSRMALGLAAGLAWLVAPGVANASGLYAGAPTTASVAETMSPSGWYQTDSVHLTLTATDTDAGVKAIAVQDDGTNPGWCIAPSDASTTIPPYPTTMTVTVEVRGPADCPVEYWAIDGNGNAEAHQSIDLKIDDRAPNIGLSTSTLTGNDVPVWSNSSVWIGSITCDDNYLAAPPAYPAQSGCTGSPDYSLDGAPAVPFSSAFYVREGRHDLLMSASDNAGNTAQLDRKLLVDLTPPNVTFDSPPHGLIVGPAVLSAQAFDPNLADGTLGSGVNLVAFVVSSVINPSQGSATYQASETAPGTWTATADLPTGVYHVEAEGMDLAGNTTWTPQTTVTVVSVPTA